MGEIVNLRSVKKSLARDAAAAEAKQNRIRHGRAKAAKLNDRRAEQRRASHLDGSRRSEVVE